MEKFNERIKRLRLQNGWSQTELAKKVGYSDRSAIAKLEAGTFDIPQSKIVALAKAFKVSSSYLMDGYDTNDMFSTFVSMSDADKLDLFKQQLIYFKEYHNSKVLEDFVEMQYSHNDAYPIKLNLTRGEYRLILELRERGEIDQSTLEEMFNTILAYKQENGLKLTDSTNKHMKFKITVKEFLNGEQ